jgi:hypothetical protein
VDALAGDLREKFRIGGPDAEEMFIFYCHASRNQTLGSVGRELLVEVSIPAQHCQVHNGVPIESFMAYNIRQSPIPTKAEVGVATMGEAPETQTRTVSLCLPITVICSKHKRRRGTSVTRQRGNCLALCHRIQSA